MLYVFHVDTGRMIKFDMNVALTSVQNLKEIIEKRCTLPADKVVLLVSGGDMLVPNSLVCSYSAGTDTNPIFMFTTIDVKPQPWPSIENAPINDIDLTEQVERCLSLPSAHSTIVASAQLGQQFFDLAREEEQICETLVHEQHLQQQGWSAVIANMEDLTEEFRKRFKKFSDSFEEHLSKREQHLELLDNFNQDLVNLSKIPILPSLLQNAEEEFHGFDDFLDNDEVFSRSHQNDSMVLQLTGSNGDLTNANKTNEDGSNKESSEETNMRKIITSSSGSSSVLEQKRPRLSKENTPEIMGITNSGGSGSNTKPVISGRSLTLLQWISAKENHDVLRVMAEECSQGLATFTAEKYEQLKTEINNIIKYAEQEEIKEIKGLEDRLSGLEKLMFNLRKMVQDQGGHSTALQQSQNRTSRLGDPSILPDLCESHRSQLKVMLSNHRQIRDYRRRISKAKDELGTNLNRRLKFIVQIENAMCERDHSLLFYHRCQRRVERHINIIQQIHQTPNIYLAAVTEVVRRRIFSGEFVQWASNLACDFDAIHNEEVERRRQFNSNFEGHFLNILFPGMNDMPPAFANEYPIIFDSCLPNITKNDIDMLTTFLPDISDNIQLPDMGNVINFFVSRSGTKTAEEKMSTTEAATPRGNILIHRPIDLHAHLKDGFESETDTEEFEKVGDRSAIGNEKISSSKQIVFQTISIATSTTEMKPEVQNTSIETDRIAMQNVETLTEENTQSYQQEMENLKKTLLCMSQISKQCLDLLKNNLQSVKADHQLISNEIGEKLTDLSQKFIYVQQHCAAQEYETLEKFKTTHEHEKGLLCAKIQRYEEELSQLKLKQNEIESSHLQQVETIDTESKQLRQTLAVRKEEIEQMEAKLHATNIEKEKALMELKEKLVHEHKTELESLRCRFKIMTSMESSASNTSLEKIEKTDMIDLQFHESILSQTREDMSIEKDMALQKAREQFLLEKEKAVQEAVATERLKWEQDNCSPSSILAVTSNMELLKKMVEEKDRQLDILRERDLMYSKDLCQLRMKFDALASDEESDKGWMKEKIDYLNRQNHRLEQELNVEKEKYKRYEMESSVSTMKCSTIDQSMVRSKLTSSQMGASASIRGPVISTDTCSPGDLVFVVWNIRHGQFVIVQESPNLFFVHADSLSALSLKLPVPGDIEIPVPFFTIGKVLNKEFCQARKDENRYKVSKGTKFFRVKLKPMTEMKWHLRRERLDSASSSSGTSVSRSTITQNLIDSFCQTEARIGVSPRSIGSEAICSASTSANCDNTDGNRGDVRNLSSVTASQSSRDVVDSMSSKERTVSISSFIEENEEPSSILSDRCRYISVSEDEERGEREPESASNSGETAGNYAKETTALSTGSNNASSKSLSDTAKTASSMSASSFLLSSSESGAQLGLNRNVEMPPDVFAPTILLENKEHTDDSDEYRSLEGREDFVEFNQAQAETSQPDSISNTTETSMSFVETPATASDAAASPSSSSTLTINVDI